MAAAQWDIVCEQGASFVRIIHWKDENEVPIQLYGYAARMQVRPSTNSSTVIVSLTQANLGISLDGASGGILLQLTAEQTNALPVRKAVYDLELVSPSGFVTRLLEGTFTIVPQVTR